MDKHLSKAVKHFGKGSLAVILLTLEVPLSLYIL
jgi:hypothetical protein